MSVKTSPNIRLMIIIMVNLLTLHRGCDKIIKLLAMNIFENGVVLKLAEEVPLLRV